MIPVQVESTELADGVWRIAGGSHHSVAVTFRDFVAIVEAPQNEERSLAVIAEVRRLIPNKPIRYVVNTHHHFDHAGGLRTYVAQSTTVVTHQGNRDFYDDVFFHPGRRILEPDILSDRMPWFGGNRIPAFETVSEKYVLSDGERTMDIYPVLGLAHNGNMLIAYLPTERILINADLYSPPAPGAQPPSANASMRSLSQNIERLNLDVERHVGVHGQVGSHADFMRSVGGD
jgi:glyoxylase-like metal-dependent hydrolase (beta-lactamase superfamily II)